MKKGLVGARSAGPAQPSVNAVMLQKVAPNLACHLCDVQWDDGDKRIPSWYRVKTTRGMWEITLSDPNYAVELRVTTDTWGELIPALEAALGVPQPAWIDAPWLERYKPKESKRKRS